MAPKYQRNLQGNVTTDKPATTATDDSSITWTGRPLDEPTWYYANKKTLYDEVEGAREFIQYGIVHLRKVRHSLRHKPSPRASLPKRND